MPSGGAASDAPTERGAGRTLRRCLSAYPAFWLGRGTRMPSRLRFQLCGIISRDGILSASRRSAWSLRRGTPSGTAAALSPVELCDALGPGPGAEPTVLFLETLLFEAIVDMPTPEGARWIIVAPPAAGWLPGA